MNIQCNDCGLIVLKQGLKIHQQSKKCSQTQELNKKCIGKCRKCGLYFDKIWHSESHVCSGIQVYDKDIEELKLKCDFYKSFIYAMGVNIDIDWGKSQIGGIYHSYSSKNIS